MRMFLVMVMVLILDNEAEDDVDRWKNSSYEESPFIYMRSSFFHLCAMFIYSFVICCSVVMRSSIFPEYSRALSLPSRDPLIRTSAISEHRSDYSHEVLSGMDELKAELRGLESCMFSR
jgi:hypothetical protein